MSRKIVVANTVSNLPSRPQHHPVRRTGNASRFHRACALPATAAVLSIVGACYQPPPQRSGAEIQLLGTLSSEVNESSGVVVSRSRDSVIWTHNDSGGEAVIYALKFSGELLAAYEVRGAENRDWEDLASGPCLEEADPSSCLYIADTGDNNGTRESVRIYVIPEPVVAPDQGPAVRQTRQRAREITLRYPAGHPDVEAMAVGLDGTVLLVTKGHRGRVQVYRILRSEMTDGSVMATLVGTIGFSPLRAVGRTPTGAAIAPQGDRLVIRTYTELFFYRVLENGGLELEGEPCFIGPIEPQGEGVDFLDERAVLLTSEARVGRPATIYKVLCAVARRRKPQ